MQSLGRKGRKIVKDSSKRGPVVDYDQSCGQQYVNQEIDGPAWNNLDFQDSFHTDLTLPDKQKGEKEIITLQPIGKLSWKISFLKDFTDLLNSKGYSYHIDSGTLIVDHEGGVYLPNLTTLPSNVQFNNKGYVYLYSLTTLPDNIQFNNEGDVSLSSLITLPNNIQFNNKGNVYLLSLTTLPNNKEQIFKNCGYKVWYNDYNEEWTVPNRVEGDLHFSSREDLKNLIDIQTCDGNWNYDNYMHGMANGMILSEHVGFDLPGEPKFLDAPDTWFDAIENEVSEVYNQRKIERQKINTLAWKVSVPTNIRDAKVGDIWNIRWEEEVGDSGQRYIYVVGRTPMSLIGVFADNPKRFEDRARLVEIFEAIDDDPADFIIFLDTIVEAEFVKNVPIVKEANQSYFDSTPSSDITVEDQIGGQVIPDGKLRRTNPKRYDKNTDWYSDMGEKGRDTGVENKTDYAPPLVSNLKFSEKSLKFENEIFVCLWLPDEARQEFNHIQNLDEDLHMTIMYEDAELSEVKKQQIVESLLQVVKELKPVKCETTALAVMANEDKSLVALVNVLEGTEIYDKVTNAVEEIHPFKKDRKYGFLPHVTLQYESEGKVNLEEFKSFAWTAKHLCLKFSDEEQYVFEIGTGRVEKTLEKKAMINSYAMEMADLQKICGILGNLEKPVWGGQVSSATGNSNLRDSDLRVEKHFPNKLSWKLPFPKEFTDVLDSKKYSYHIGNGTLIIDHEGYVSLYNLTTLPNNIQFNNEGYVNLSNLATLPNNIQFNNEGDVSLYGLATLPNNIQFNNGGDISLSNLITLPDNIQFNNEGNVYLHNLTTLPDNKEQIFKNYGYKIWYNEGNSSWIIPNRVEGSKLSWKVRISPASEEHLEDIYEKLTEELERDLRQQRYLGDDTPQGFNPPVEQIPEHYIPADWFQHNELGDGIYQRYYLIQRWIGSAYDVVWDLYGEEHDGELIPIEVGLGDLLWMKKTAVLKFADPLTYTDRSDLHQTKQEFDNRAYEFQQEDRLMSRPEDKLFGEVAVKDFPSTKVYQDMDEDTGYADIARSSSCLS